MTDLITAAQQALEAICGAKLCEFNSMSSRHEMVRLLDEAITTLRAALAEPEKKYLCSETGELCGACNRRCMAEPVQEPVAWTLTRTLTERKTTTNGYLWFSDPVNSSWTPLYTAPPQRKPLTEEEIAIALSGVLGIPHEIKVELAREVERAHNIGEEK